MAAPSRLRRWVPRTVWSLGLLTVVLVGSIVSVTMLSRRDAITLAGGIAVFAVSITAWFAVTTAIWVRALQTWRREADLSPPDVRPEIERTALIDR